MKIGSSANAGSQRGRMQWRIDGVDGKENFVILSNDSNLSRSGTPLRRRSSPHRLDGDLLYVADAGRTTWKINLETGARRKVHR